MKKRLAAIRKYNNMPRVLNRIIKDNEPEIIAMNRDQMWEDGIVDVNNPSAILDYAPSTVQSKKRRARYKRTDHITLKWSGDYHKGMKIKQEPEQFTIISTKVPYPGFMDGRFGNSLGLIEENKEELRQLIKSDLIIGFKDALQNT